MHRPERQVKDIERIREFIRESKVGRLGLYDGNEVYIVPMNLGYEDEEGEKLTFYLHCALVGRKIDIIKKNPNVCLEIDGRHELQTADVPCNYGYYYMSLIGNGKIEIVSDMEEKKKGLTATMKQQTGKAMSNFEDKWVNAVCVLKLELTDYTVKEHAVGMRR